VAAPAANSTSQQRRGRNAASFRFGALRGRTLSSDTADMFQGHLAWVAHQRARWLRPDAHLFVRPDAHRFMPPGAPWLNGKDAVRYFWPDASGDRPEPALDHKHDAHLAVARASLLELRRQVAALAFRLKFRRLLREKAYNPNQPRLPAGNPDGGQWTSGEGGSGRIRFAQAGGTVTDVDGTPYYKPGGHHEVPRKVFGKWNLRPETRKVFENATTGKVPRMLLRTTPDGVAQGHFWNGPNGAHRHYNDAVQELADRFLERNNIRPERMAPSQAWDLLREVRLSQDARIRVYNSTIRLLRRLFPLRTGRGTE
jgi:hypothetical protein